MSGFPKPPSLIEEIVTNAEYMRRNNKYLPDFPKARQTFVCVHKDMTIYVEARYSAVPRWFAPMERHSRELMAANALFAQAEQEGWLFSLLDDKGRKLNVKAYCPAHNPRAASNIEEGKQDEADTQREGSRLGEPTAKAEYASIAPIASPRAMATRARGKQEKRPNLQPRGQRGKRDLLEAD